MTGGQFEGLQLHIEVQGELARFSKHFTIHTHNRKVGPEIEFAKVVHVLMSNLTFVIVVVTGQTRSLLLISNSNIEGIQPSLVFSCNLNHCLSWGWPRW